jgi:hypothetical protein
LFSGRINIGTPHPFPTFELQNSSFALFMNERPPFRHNFSYYAMYLMTIFYVAAGVAMLTVLRFESLSDTNRKIIGFVLIAYGFFRMFVIRKRYRS